MGPEGAALLAKALPDLPALKSLDLGYNPLGPKGGWLCRGGGVRGVVHECVRGLKTCM